MSALSKLLTRVAKRVLANNPTNGDMLSAADRVAAWRSADYITDEQVDEIASAVPEPSGAPEGAETPEGAQEPAEAEGEEPEGEPEGVEGDLSDKTKAELLELARERGIEVYDSWTKAEVVAAIEEAGARAE